MFNFGLLMVDMSWHVKTHPHYRQKSLGYIIDKIEKLLLIKRFNAYSFLQLGIVVHYLCDFCCNAHMSGSIGSIPYHVKYEYDLQKYLLENFEVFKKRFQNKSSNINVTISSLSSIKTSIGNRLHTYMKGEASYLWDITQCIEISSIVCSAVFNYNTNLSNNFGYSRDPLELSQ